MTHTANPRTIQTARSVRLDWRAAPQLNRFATRAAARFAALAFVLLATPFKAAHAQSALSGLGTGILETVVYSLVGIVMAVIGFKVVDWLTPGNLAEDVAHKENRALAILAGSMILGVCVIIASVLVD